MGDAAPLGVVFVHGIRSSAKVWAAFTGLMAEDADLDFVEPLLFEYATGLVSLHPLRRLPSFDDVADSLKVYLDTEAQAFQQLVLVSHSQGGLVVQRCLARMLAEGRTRELRRIRHVVMFACPNSGSELALTTRRRWMPRNLQERQLRPLDSSVADTQRIVLDRLVNTSDADPGTPRIPITTYAGESDGVVTPQSARGTFPDVGVLPGDHFTIVRPTSASHRSYTALKRHVLHLKYAAPVQEPASSPGQATLRGFVSATVVDGTVTGVDTDQIPRGGVDGEAHVERVTKTGWVKGVRFRQHPGD